MTFDRLEGRLLISLEKCLHEEELGAVFEVDEAVLSRMLAEISQKPHRPRSYLLAHRNTPRQGCLGVHDVRGLLNEYAGVAQT